YGGTLYIGKNDNGEVVGLDTMGIVADVNLLYENELQYIEIVVDKYPSLISYHGKYYYRSGSTMRTITGKELDKAILKSQGRTWDG
ncbi:ATP-dependent DNA helicase RecG, partial [Klebsiella oxytoca]